MNSPTPVAELHSLLFQLGARPTPPSIAGDGRPPHISQAQLCDELGLEHHIHNGAPAPAMSTEEFLAHPCVQNMLDNADSGQRHCRIDMERMFPKSAPKAARTS